MGKYQPRVLSLPRVKLIGMKSVASIKTPSPSHELLVGFQHLWHGKPWLVIAVPVAFVLSVVVKEIPRRRHRWR